MACLRCVAIAGTIEVEGLLFAAGIAIYRRLTRPRDAQGKWSFVAFIVVMSALWLSGPFSPPPPSVMAVAIAGIILIILLPIWSAWIERHRELRPR